MRTTPDPGHDPSSERGAVLLVVFLLSTVLVLLAASLMALTETRLRCSAGGWSRDYAELAARSGVEWAVMNVAANRRETALNAIVPIDTDLDAVVELRPGETPNVFSTGRYRGTSVLVQAEVRAQSHNLPYMLAVFGGTSAFTENLTCEGPSYFGDLTTPIKFSSTSTYPGLTVTGNLDFAGTPTVPDGFVNLKSGAVIRTGVTEVRPPVWDTTPFTTLTSGAVTVYHLNGSTTQTNQVFNGIVVCHVVSGNKVTFDNCTINGALVVTAPYTTDPFPNMAPNTLTFKDNVTIKGGTTLTGPLAVLAPDCEVKFTNPLRIQLQGVVYVGEITAAKYLEVKGMLVVRGPVTNTLAMKVSYVGGAGLADVTMGTTIIDLAKPEIRWSGRP